MATLSKINLKNTFGAIKEKINIFFKKSSKKRLTIAFSLVLILFLVPFHAAQASIWSGLSGIIQTALFAGPYILIWLFMGIASVFVWIALWLIDSALSPAIYMATINSAAIDRGWIVMRDTANLFFILILIFIAIATVLRLQSYSAKTWIPRLLFGAVFINFSKTITMFIIDIGNMFMYGAIGWMGQGIENTGINKLGYAAKHFFVDMNFVSTLIDNGITLTNMVEVFMGLMFNLVLALTLLGFAILLLIRVSMLAILTIFSPIAFMLHAWPNAGKYSGQWWGSLLKYIVFGPIIVFFLFIASEMAVTLFQMGAFLAPPTTSVSEVNFGSFLGPDGLFAVIIPFIIVIIILIAGLSFTAEMGVYGAGLIMGSVKGLAMGSGAIVGGLALSSLANKGQRGAGWLSGANKARKEGRLKQYGKDTLKGIPGWKGSFVGNVKDATIGNVQTAGREVKDQAVMAYRKYQENQRKKAKERAAKLNLDEAATKERYKNSKSAEEASGYEEYGREKGYAMIDRGNEDKQQKLLKEAMDRNAPQDELAAIRKVLEDIKKQNDEKERKIVDISILGGGKKSDIYASRPDLEAIPLNLTNEDTEDTEKEKRQTRQTQIEKRLMKMQDEGISFNKINKEAYRDPEFIAALRKIGFQNDTDKFNHHLENRSNEVRNNAQSTLKQMLSGQTNFSTTDATPGGGYTNFQNASSLAFLQKGNIKKIFHEQSSAITDFARHNYRDLGTFDRNSLITIAKNIDKTTLARIRPENLSPADAKLIADTIKDATAATGRPRATQEDKDVYDYIIHNEAWGGKRGRATVGFEATQEDTEAWENAEDAMHGRQPRHPRQPNP